MFSLLRQLMASGSLSRTLKCFQISSCPPCLVQAMHITASSAMLLFQINDCCYCYLGGTKGWDQPQEGPDQVPAKLWGIRAGSVKMHLLITLLTNGLFAAAWRNTGDQNGDDTRGITIGCQRRNRSAFLSH